MVLRDQVRMLAGDESLQRLGHHEREGPAPFDVEPGLVAMAEGVEAGRIGRAAYAAQHGAPQPVLIRIAIRGRGRS